MGYQVAIGGLAGGFAHGLETGARMASLDEDTKRRKKMNERDTARDAAYKQLADLAESFVNTGKAPYEPSGTAGMAARGFGYSGGMPGTAAPGEAPPTAAAPDAGMASAPSNVAARTGVKIDVPEPEPQSAPQPAPQSGPQSARGPANDEQRFGYALYRQPALLNHPEFIDKAANLMLRTPGMGEDGLKWLLRSAQVQKENGIDALKKLAAGDGPGAIQAFNASGTKVDPESVKQLEGGKWQYKIAGTDQVRVVDPVQSLRSLLSPHDYFTLSRQEAADKATAAYRDRSAGETERHNRAREDIQRGDSETRRRLGDARVERGQFQPETALQRNLRTMVESGIADDERHAFTLLRGKAGKSEQDTIIGLSKLLMQRPGYMGRDGPARAMADATKLVRTSSDDQPAAPPSPAAPAQPGGRPPLDSFFR